MEIEKERIRSLLQEIEKSHEQGFISNEAYAMLKKDYEAKLTEPETIESDKIALEAKVFFLEGLRIECKRGEVEMGACHFVPVSVRGQRVGGIFFGKGHYRIFFDEIEDSLGDTTFILKEGFSPEGRKIDAPEFLERARNALKGASLQYDKEGWRIRNIRKKVLWILGEWSCELYLSDAKVELKAPTLEFLWNESIKFKKPAKEFTKSKDCMTFKTPTTIELTPHSLKIRRPAESIFLSSNELLVEKPAKKMIYKNWEQGILPQREKIRHEVERMLEGLLKKEDMEKYRFLFEGEEAGEREILIDKPASRLEMGMEGLKVETPTSKLFFGKDGKIFVKTPTSHISLSKNGESYTIDKMDELLRDFNIDLDLKDLDKSFKRFDEKMKKMGRIPNHLIPPLPPLPPVHPLSSCRTEGEKEWRGRLENPAFFIRCNGDVEIRGHEGNEYRVRIDEDGEPDFRVEGNNIYINAHENVRMDVPKKSDINLTITGDTMIRGLSGNLMIHASSGDVELKNVESEDLRIEAIAGDMMLDCVSGKAAVLESSSGSVEGEVEFEDCTIKTDSGDVVLKVHGVNCAIHVSSGDIELETEKKYSIDAVCEDGEIEIEGEERGTACSFSQENPQVFLTLRTMSGNIRLN